MLIGMLAITTLALAQETGSIETNAGVTEAAQSPAALVGPDDENADLVVVTGSRVVRNGYSAPSPTTIVGPEELDAVAPANIADYVNSLPVFPGTATTREGNNSISAGVTGMNRLDLRGIGTNRTLVLIDGRRFVGSTLGGDVDVNGIPNALIERVEIVTGGASAVYGSNAVAGVINFVMDTDFTGLKGDLQYHESSYGDDEQYKANLTYGTPFAAGRGHFLLSGEHARNNGVPDSFKRRWFRQWDTLVNPDGTPEQITRSGVIDTRVAAGGLITGGPLAGTTFDPGGTPRPFDYGILRAGVLSVGGEGDGFYSVISLDGELTRDYLFGRLSYELSRGFELFTESSYSKAEAVTNSSRNYFRANQTIHADNAYLHPNVKDAMAEAGLDSFPYGFVLGIASPRVEVETYRGVLGLNGELPSGFQWNSYYQYGQADVSDQINNVTNKGNLQLALDAVEGPGGQIVCRSTLVDPDNRCVPINTFGGNAVSDAALAYVNGTPWLAQQIEQHVVATSISGEPFSSWAGPVRVAGGAEYRHESVSGDSDQVGMNGGWLFGNFRPTSGSISVKEVFAESLVPLAKGRSMVESLDLNGAVRLTDYDVSGNVNTWKVGLSYEPFDGLRFRATQSRDIRAPNLSDLYQAGLTQRNNVDDPFRNNVSTNFERVSSGNLSLDPEVGDTTSFGVVFRPDVLPQFHGSIDYFSIDIEDAITTLSNQQVVDRCFEGDQTLCEAIVRNDEGVITTIFIRPINIASLKVSGVDFDFSFRETVNWPASDTTINLRLLASRVFEYVQDNSFVSHDFAGENGGSVPDWRINGMASLQKGPVDLTMSARFTSAGVLNNDWIEGVDIDDNHVPSIMYFDLGGSYRFANNRSEVYFRVNNLFNKEPPVVATELLGTNPTLYDTIGRVYRIGVRFAL
jgi:outer membrane receptor protein involved in Fe transport